jgi:hypothetical protein
MFPISGRHRRIAGLHHIAATAGASGPGKAAQALAAKLTVIANAAGQRLFGGMHYGRMEGAGVPTVRLPPREAADDRSAGQALPWPERLAEAASELSTRLFGNGPGTLRLAVAGAALLPDAMPVSISTTPASGPSSSGPPSKRQSAAQAVRSLTATAVEHDPQLRLYATLGTAEPPLCVRQIRERPELLQAMLARCVESGLNPLEAFCSHVVTPALRVFRTLLDGYGLAWCNLGSGKLAFEVLPHGEATGRIALSGLQDDLQPDALLMANRPPTSADAAVVEDQGGPDFAGALHGLHDELAALVDALARCRFEGAVYPTDVIWDETLRTVQRELRFLAPDTAHRLNVDQPFRAFNHSTSASQDAALARVIAAVEQASSAKRNDAALPCPVVVMRACEPLPAGYPRLVHRLERAGGIVMEADSLDALHAAAPGWRRDYDVVAVFHPAQDDRDQLAQALPGVLQVGVCRDQDRPHDLPPPSADRLWIQTLEERPRQVATECTSFLPTMPPGATLSEFALGELRSNLVAERNVVNWDERQVGRFVGQLADGGRQAAAAKAEKLKKSDALSDDALDRQLIELIEETRRRADMGEGEPLLIAADEFPAARIALRIRHVLTHKPFLQGKSGFYSPEQAVRDMLPFIKKGKPIPFAMLGFTLKMPGNGLKVADVVADAADPGALARLLELRELISALYAPGIELLLMSDGMHFRPHPPARLERFRHAFEGYLDQMDMRGFVRFEDYDALGREVSIGGRNLHELRREATARLRADYQAAFAGLDITHDPRATLKLADEHDPHGRFVSMFRAMIYSVSLPAPPGRDPVLWFEAVYANPFDLTDRTLPADVIEARRQLLQATWEETLTYVVAYHADEAVRYKQHVAPGAVILTGSPKPGNVGLSLLGATTVNPWHASAMVDDRGQLRVAFRALLRDHGYGHIVGPDGPFLHLPPGRIRAGLRGLEVDPDFLALMRLRGHPIARQRAA